MIEASTLPSAPTAPEIEKSGHLVGLLRNHAEVLIRPVCDEDAALERAFIERLSPEARRQRFLGRVAITDELVRKLTHIDPKREEAFVALVTEPEGQRIVGVGRFANCADGEQCEFAVTVADDWQRQGLGTLLLQQLIESARERGLHCIYSLDSAVNSQIHELVHTLGFSSHTDPEDSTQVIYRLQL